MISDNQRKKTAPELLCPVGSFEVLRSAVAAGADAVYLGAYAFNARINAHNFDADSLTEAVALAHDGGTRVYLTLNTAIFDREMGGLLSTAEAAARSGVDAFIVADLGAAAEIHRALPNMPLHASTQMSGHCADIGKVLRGKGFTRFVIAREATLSDLEHAVQSSGLEVEAFVHGALCVSHSGQCLFSSVVGGHSGNRGECAQPCRLPYCTRRGTNGYPLSLKDLSLAAHVPALIDSGVASLKIEGRMKSADYVRTVTSIWRLLLDDGRSATQDELRELADAFSRGGFTDGYFTGKINSSMMGIRSDDDKEKTALLARRPLPKQGFLPVDMQIEIKADAPATLSVSAPVFRQGNATVSSTAEGQLPEIAQTRPLTQDDVCKNLSKTGGTAYTPSNINVALDEGLIMPLSSLNSMRREALSALDRARGEYISSEVQARCKKGDTQSKPVPTKGVHRRDVTARFLDPNTVSADAVEYFSVIYLPLDVWFARKENVKVPADKLGVILPPVIFDRERCEAREMLTSALRHGISRVMIGNIGHIPLVREASAAANVKMPALCGDYRLNVTNNATARELETLGIDEFILSPELSLPQMRDIDGNAASVVYGRITLMTLEKCAIRELYSSNACDICGKDSAVMRDRRGVCFPVLREWKHRNIVLNSLPISMTDKEDDLRRANVTSRHFIFTVEDADGVNAVISAAKANKPVREEARRIAK
ncbi:MAG: U32 family peptidase [Ruminococcaceae bacterium]|nr:U32 family peptidase [Oscillospiraceae bacterium]